MTFENLLTQMVHESCGILQGQHFGIARQALLKVEPLRTHHTKPYCLAPTALPDACLLSQPL